MNTTTTFDQAIAEKFDETRPIDPEQCRRAFQSALSAIKDIPEPRILDLGCGTGRLLACLLSEFPARSKIVGVDIGEHMIDVAKRKPCFDEDRVEFVCESLFDYGASDNCGHFDLVICHWLFHTVPEWQAAVIATLRMVKPEGMLVWMSEDGDLYKALDEVRDPKTWMKVDRLFHIYHDAVASVQPAFNPVARAGTLLRNSAVLQDLLKQCGWATTEESTHQVTWVETKSVEWIIENVIQPRVFTNLRNVRIEHHGQAVTVLKGLLGKNSIPKIDDRLNLSFNAHLHRASRDKFITDFERAAKSILHVANEMRGYGLHYAYHSDKGATEEIRTILRPFLDSIVRADLSPLWEAFWNRIDPNKGESNAPLWAWARIWDHTAKFEDSLNKFIYRFKKRSDWNDEILRAYFNSPSPFVSLARDGETGFEPVELLKIDDKVVPTVERIDLSCKISDKEPSGRKALRICFPQAFFDPDGGVCPNLNEKDFNQSDWSKACGQWLQSIDEMKTPFLKATHEALAVFGRQLDSLLLKKRFSGRQGLKNVVGLLHAVSLFPEKALYLFPVPKLKGDVGATLTLAFEHRLHDVQILTVQHISESLFLLPSIVESARPTRERLPDERPHL